jgi:hypothetical protein
MQMIGLTFVCALAVATLAPAPAHNEDRLLMSLLGTVFLAVVVMGVLALLDLLTGTAILAAIGASIMVPCAWLARAPEADVDDAEQDEDDGGGGGIPPYEPSPQGGPDGWRPAPALSFATIPQAPAIGGALAAAGPRAELTPPTYVPTQSAPAPRPLNPRFPLILTAPWSEPRPPVVISPPAFSAPEPAAAEPAPRRPRLARGEHRSIVHRRRAAGRHEGRRRAVMRFRLLQGWRRRPWSAGCGDAESPAAADDPR